MLQWLIEILESGEHMLTVVGVGGTTQKVLSITFLEALIEKMQAQEPMQAPAPTVATITPDLTDKLMSAEPEMAPVPTPEQIAAFIRANPTAGMTIHVPEGEATGAPPATFQAQGQS